MLGCVHPQKHHHHHQLSWMIPTYFNAHFVGLRPGIPTCFAVMACSKAPKAKHSGMRSFSKGTGPRTRPGAQGVAPVSNMRQSVNLDLMINNDYQEGC